MTFSTTTVSTSVVEAKATSATVVRTYYFGTQPSAISLSAQITTIAHNQGWQTSPGDWTWIELALITGAPETGKDATPFIKKDESGNLLTWRSHYIPVKKEWNIQVGPVFDGNSDLIKKLETGDIIGVIVAAQYPAWDATVRQGTLTLEGETN